jgi:hypothetical protein
MPLSYHAGTHPVIGRPGRHGLAFASLTCSNRLEPSKDARVPTLLRFLFVIAVLAGLGFAAMFALATLVEPEPREMTVTIPASRLPSR